MMKRKFLAVILPIIGCATVVGSGFSAWYFGDATQPYTFNNEIGINLTPSTNSPFLTIGDNEQFSNKRVVLDQGGFGNTDNKKGIMIGSDADHTTIQSSFNWAGTITYNGVETPLSELGKAKFKLVFTLEIKVEDVLDEYLTVNTSNAVISIGEESTNASYEYLFSQTSSGSSDGTTFGWTYEIQPNLLETYNSTSKTWYIGVDFSTDVNKINKVFEYRESHDAVEKDGNAEEGSTFRKPQSYNEYLLMQEDIGTKKVIFGVKAELIDTIASTNALE